MSQGLVVINGLGVAIESRWVFEVDIRVIVNELYPIRQPLWLELQN